MSDEKQQLGDEDLWVIAEADYEREHKPNRKSWADLDQATRDGWFALARRRLRRGA